MDKYDLLVIGGSAAATTAGIYAARRGLKFKIISKDFGGEVATSGEIGNWPGNGTTDGIALADKFKKHLEQYKVDIEEGVEVESVKKQEDGSFLIKTKDPSTSSGQGGQEYQARTVIISTGVRPRSLDVPGEKEFRNKGVSYCTTCDGPLFGGKVVATIGGGNSALESGLMLADIASKVYVINKNPEFKGDKILMENLKKKQNVEIIFNAKTTEIFGNQFVAGLKYNDGNSEKDIKIDGAFIHIGMIPNSGIAPEGTEKNQFGEITVNKNCETNILGLYAAGDVTDAPFKQIVIAAGQGCIAALSAVQYLNRR